jgi:hypothetical protein
VLSSSNNASNQSQGTSYSAGAQATVQVGATAVQPSTPQGAAGTQAFVAKNIVVAQKGKKEKCFHCNLLADHVGTECTAVLCIYCDSALHSDAIAIFFRCQSQLQLPMVSVVKSSCGSKFRSPRT